MRYRSKIKIQLCFSISLYLGEGYPRYLQGLKMLWQFGRSEHLRLKGLEENILTKQTSVQLGLC